MAHDLHSALVARLDYLLYRFGARWRRSCRRWQRRCPVGLERRKGGPLSRIISHLKAQRLTVCLLHFQGLGTIFAGFIIAPSIAAGFGAIIFLFTKFVVLRRKDSLRAALMASPLYFFTVAAICTSASLSFSLTPFL